MIGYKPTLKDIAKAHIDVIPVWTAAILISIVVAFIHLACGLGDVVQHNDFFGFISLLSIVWLITIGGFFISLLHNAEINKRAMVLYKSRKNQEYSARY